MNRAVLDPRINAYRPDLADARLKGVVEAERFASGVHRRVAVAAAPLKAVPREDAPLDSELIYGEIFRVFADTAEGWSWGQCLTDDYVGFLPTEALAPTMPEPTHRVTALRTFVYPKAELRLPPVTMLSLGARVALGEEETARGTRYLHLLGTDAAIFAADVAPLGASPEADFVAVAERFLHTPFLWGGRTSLGLDCSALLQLSLLAAGIAAPRDTDMQAAGLGEPVPDGVETGVRRGDLIFWPAHVSIATAPDRVVHASGHHMRVVAEPLVAVMARVSAIKGPPLAVRRLFPIGEPVSGDKESANA